MTKTRNEPLLWRSTTVVRQIGESQFAAVVSDTSRQALQVCGQLHRAVPFTSLILAATTTTRGEPDAA